MKLFIKDKNIKTNSIITPLFAATGTLVDMFV